MLNSTKLHIIILSIILSIASIVILDGDVTFAVFVMMLSIGYATTTEEE